MNIEANKGNVTPAGIDTENLQIVQDMLTKTKGYKVSEVTTLYIDVWQDIDDILNKLIAIKEYSLKDGISDEDWDEIMDKSMPIRDYVEECIHKCLDDALGCRVISEI